MSGKARWPGSCAKDANRRDGEPPIAPRLVPGANLSSSRDGNSRPLWATAAQRTTEASTTEKGRREAPRAKTPRAATSRHRHILARAACLLRVWTSSSTTARPLPPSHRVAHRRPLRAQRCRSPQRCRSRRLTEPLRQLALRYRRPPPTLGHYRGRAERRARRCGAGSGFYSASGTISPLYSRSSSLLNNIYCPGITPGLALLAYVLVQ